MSTLALLIVLLGVAPIEVHLAPDQPLPYVYVDDPLILELKSPTDTQATVRIDLETAAGAPQSLDLGQVTLRAKGTFWQALTGIPSERGRYQAKVTVTVNGVPVEETRIFCRIDRPIPADGVPWGAHLDAADATQLLAMAAIPMRSVHLRAAMPEIESRIAQAAAAGFVVELLLDGSGQETGDAAAEALAKAVGDRVSRWDLNVAGSPERLTALTHALQRAGVRAPIGLLTGDPKVLAAMFDAGAGQFIQHLVIQRNDAASPDIAAFRAVAEKAGYESLPFHLLLRGAKDLGAAALVRQQVTILAEGFGETHLDAPLLFREGVFQESYAPMSALVHRFNGTAYVGPLATDSTTVAQVFRSGNGWIMAFWCTEGSKKTAVTLGDAAGLGLTGSLNNPLPAPEVKDGVATLAGGPEPHFLRGVGGKVLSQASSRAAKQEAKSFADNGANQKLLAKEFLDLVKGIGQMEAGKSVRPEFLALLRGFPAIEEQWHAGKIPRAVAAPALAALARLSRDLCVVQQESGEPFIEPLRKTLDECGKYQSQYLTSSGGAQGARERGDWLSREVSRLITEAESLDRDGRPIEAAAVAALAEWRARSLEFAVKAAPLSKPDPFVQLTPAPEEPKEKEAAPPKTETKKPVTRSTTRKK